MCGSYTFPILPQVQESVPLEGPVPSWFSDYLVSWWLHLSDEFQKSFNFVAFPVFFTLHCYIGSNSLSSLIYCRHKQKYFIVICFKKCRACTHIHMEARLKEKNKTYKKCYYYVVEFWVIYIVPLCAVLYLLNSLQTSNFTDIM